MWTVKNNNKNNNNNKKKKKKSSSLLLGNTFMLIIISYIILFIITITLIGGDDNYGYNMVNDGVPLITKFTNFTSTAAAGGSSIETNHQQRNQPAYHHNNDDNNDDNNDNDKNDNNNDDDQKIIIEDETMNYDSSPFSYLTMYGDHRAHDSFKKLPGWIQDYIQWNRSQEGDGGKNNKYLVLMCLPDDNSCGGLSDRFRGFLYYLFLARVSNRKLCIYWTRPFPLQTFLLPTKYGFDWRCPEDQLDPLVDQSVSIRRQSKFPVFYFGNHCDDDKELMSCLRREIDNLSSCNEMFAITRLYNSVPNINRLLLVAQRYSYDNMMPWINQWQHADMTEDLFRVLFKPIPKLAYKVNITMSELGLVEKEYVSVHVRARYPTLPVAKSKKRDAQNAVDKSGILEFADDVKTYLVNIVENAIQCGHLLAPELPMYFASDHNEVTKFTLSKSFIGRDDGVKFQPVGLQKDKMPVHIGVREFQNINLDDFYPVFEDLLIMGGSRCVAHGIGSFGSFGAGLAGNRCRAVHRMHTGKAQTCPNDRGQRIPVKILDSEKPFEEGDLFGKWPNKLNLNITKISEN